MSRPRSQQSIIQRQLKLDLRPAQERLLVRWLWHLTGVYNWAIRKIELDAKHGIYHSRYDIESLLNGHSAKVGLPAHVLHDTVRTAHLAWQRCFRQFARRPRLKSRRNKLNSIAFHDRFRPPIGCRIHILGLGRVKFHDQQLPSGRLKCGRIVRRASGWYLCLLIEAEPNAIPSTGDEEVGIDPGFSSLLTLSTGEKIDQPRELQRSAGRLAQAQRGKNGTLTARLLERQGNQRKDRNHKLSRWLVSEHALIAWSADQHRNIARRFGKSVASAAHGQLRQMLAYKCRTGGREFIEVPPRNSTRICSTCRAFTGPVGWAELSVRHWTCAGCGAQHDRDVNAARNTLRVGRGMRHEGTGDGSPEIATRVPRRSPSPRSGHLIAQVIQ